MSDPPESPIHGLRWCVVAAYTLIICAASGAGGFVVALLARAHVAPPIMVGPLLGACTTVVLVGTFAALGRYQTERASAHAFWVGFCAWMIAGLNVVASLSTPTQWFGAAAVIAATACIGVGLGAQLPRREIAREPILPPPQPTWTAFRLVRDAAIIGIAWQVAQVAVLAVWMSVLLVSDPDLDLEAWSAEISTNGFAFALAVLAGAAVAVPLIYFLVRRRDEHPWRFIGFRACSLRRTLLGVITMVAFVGVSDGISLAFGRPVVPSFVSQIYASAGSLPLLAFTLVIVAPLVEEMMFRGFLLSVCEALGIAPRTSLVISAAVWAVVHLHYDVFGILTIFAMGLLLGVVRMRTSSILPCIAMHAVANAISLAEAAVVAQLPAV